MTGPDPTVIDVRGTPVTTTVEGTGRPVLLLHGGGGPVTVAAFAHRLAVEHDLRVVVPVHPGFDGTPRPDGLRTMAGLATLYTELLEVLDLQDVTVVGNSVGGWITTEMALLRSPRVGRYVVVDGGGLVVDGAAGPDFFTLDMSKVADVSYYEPDRFRIDVDSLPPVARQRMAGNRQALALYGGEPMADPTLLSRLPDAAGPALVVWGAADGMYPLGQGEAYAAAWPGARLEVIERAGHLPQLETPEALAALLLDFMD